jgi:hypothetical protein
MTMTKASDQPLQPNPFNTYRDPQTGLWVVIQSTSLVTHNSDRQPSHLNSNNTVSTQSYVS